MLAESMAVRISEDKSLLDRNMIFAFLTERSTWAKGIKREIVDKAIEHSLCIGAYAAETGEQVGFARVITDYATYANLVDVFVPEEHRGKKISKKLMDYIFVHPDLVGVRRFTLVTSTAGWLYEKFGFTKLHAPDAHMEILRSDIYTRAQ